MLDCKMPQNIFLRFMAMDTAVQVITAGSTVPTSVLLYLLHRVQSFYKTIPMFCLGDILASESLQTVH